MQPSEKQQTICQVKIHLRSLLPNLPLFFPRHVQQAEHSDASGSSQHPPFHLITLISSCKLMPVSTSEHFLRCLADFLVLFDLDRVLPTLMSSCTKERVAFGVEGSESNASFRYAYDICSVHFSHFMITNGRLDLQSGAKAKIYKKHKNRRKGSAGRACQM